MDEDISLPPEKSLECFFLDEGLSLFRPGCLREQGIADILEGALHADLSNISSLEFDDIDMYDKLFIDFSGLEVRPTFDQVVHIISAVREVLGIGGDDR
jgi:hypothetical protein